MLLFLLMLGCAEPAAEDTAPPLWTPTVPTESGRHVRFETSLGTLDLELYLEDAPLSTGAVLTYIDEGFYDGTDGLGATVIHRVEPDFVIQGGGELDDGTRKQTHPPIVNEALSSGLLNLHYTVAMARQAEADTATAQWFVNLKDNAGLDPNPDVNPDGYSVFGIVTAGHEVVDAIAEVPVDGSRPQTPIYIQSASRITAR